MSKMVYLPYVRFEQEEGEPKGKGWYFTQYNAETGEGKGWHGTEFMPDCLFETKCEGGEPATKFFDVNTNEPIKQWSWPEPPNDNAFTNYGSLDEFVASNSQKVFRVVDLDEEAYGCPCMIYGRLSTMIELADKGVLLGIQVLQESDDGMLYDTDTLEYYKLNEIRLTSCQEDMARHCTDEAAERIANYTWNAYGSFSRFAEKNKDKVFRVIVKPEFCGNVPEDSFDARRCKMSSVVTLPDDDILIGLRMFDIAQVEYRKLSEVHLQCRADDNQLE